MRNGKKVFSRCSVRTDTSTRGGTGRPTPMSLLHVAARPYAAARERARPWPSRRARAAPASAPRTNMMALDASTHRAMFQSTASPLDDDARRGVSASARKRAMGRHMPPASRLILQINRFLMATVCNDIYQQIVPNFEHPGTYSQDEPRKVENS